ncbi:MAG: stage 0 sporulation protein [Ardenticatenaceae bacterium]|nr:stage 0 sporulation protein [Ardenticatenaceae bacterium]
MEPVVGIRFQKLGKLYHFSVGTLEDIQAGDHVVVETKRGNQLGQVIAFVEPEKVFQRRNLRPVTRKANPRDLVLRQVWQDKELSALITCREKAHQLGVKDVKFVKAEYSFDGTWLTFYYATENKKLRLNNLQNALTRSFRTRVELQLIGPRDVAKYLGGHGACSGPRCCSTFLTDFSPVSIRMAKAQGISLNPQEITGMCGRLRCCLVYEYEQYVEAKKNLPKVGKRIDTPQGPGKVRDVRALRDSILVELEETGEYVEIFREQMEPLEELEALQKKAEAGCAKHEGGGCDCGAKTQSPSEMPSEE